MKRSNLEALSIEELWDLRQNVSSALTRKMELKLQKLDHWLTKLNVELKGNSEAVAGGLKVFCGKTPIRRAYPKVRADLSEPDSPLPDVSGAGHAASLGH